ncbi:transposase, partial [bacterium]|nr:transposase [bacterium]
VEELPEIQERLDEAGLKPEEQYADAGFVNGQTILDSAEKGISLEGPSSGRSQSFEAFQDPERPLDIADFDVGIDENNDELTVHSCPAKQEPLDQNRSFRTGRILAHFSPEVCSSCKLKGRCPVKIGKQVSTLNIDEAGYAGAARHHKYMNNKDYRKKCSIRAGAEGMVSELVRKHGVRRARHRTQIRTKLQLIFAALACNVKRFIAHGQNYGYLAPAAALNGLNALFLDKIQRIFLFSFPIYRNKWIGGLIN